jgi:hypothetical protein
MPTFAGEETSAQIAAEAKVASAKKKSAIAMTAWFDFISLLNWSCS